MFKEHLHGQTTIGHHIKALRENWEDVKSHLINFNIFTHFMMLIVVMKNISVDFVLFIALT